MLARERALRAAVLIDAIRCLLGKAEGRERHVRQNASRWILSCDRRSPFSFHNVCDSLGFEPARIRRLLLTRLLGSGAAPLLAIGGGAGPVRRPRRDRARYVVFEGGRT